MLAPLCGWHSSIWRTVLAIRSAAAGDACPIMQVERHLRLTPIGFPPASYWVSLRRNTVKTAPKPRSESLPLPVEVREALTRPRACGRPDPSQPPRKDCSHMSDINAGRTRRAPARPGALLMRRWPSSADRCSPHPPHRRRRRPPPSRSMSHRGHRGQTLEVTASAAGVTDLYAYSLVFTYDPQLLKFDAELVDAVPTEASPSSRAATAPSSSPTRVWAPRRASRATSSSVASRSR